jgi:hypothetical protein
MQTLVQVLCTRGPSLREAIADDPKLSRHHFWVQREQKAGRKPGWLKLHSSEPDRRGAINVEWEGPTHLLRCRIITKGAGKPNLIAGDFVDYLLARHRGRIQSIMIVPR